MNNLTPKIDDALEALLKIIRDINAPPMTKEMIINKLQVYGVILTECDCAECLGIPL